MTLSQSSEINLTDNGKQALKAQISANNAYNLANNAQDLANGAQKTADGKNSVYRGTDPNTVPKTGLKEGDIYFTDNTLYTWNGSAWEETVSDTTGAEIHAKVEAAMQESQKAVADLKTNVEAKVKDLDDEIAKNKIQTGNALNFYKEQYYLSTSYTELAGGSWSDEVPAKTDGKYVWSRYITANIGDPTNYQYSNPVCISGLDGEDGADVYYSSYEMSPNQQTLYLTDLTPTVSATNLPKFGSHVIAPSGKVYEITATYPNANPPKYGVGPQLTNLKGPQGDIGPKGDTGDQGIPGPKGVDGQTTYVHFAYANSADGKLNFNTSYFSDALYVGTYTDYTQTDSNDYTKYTWSRLKGATGPQGPQGDKGDSPEPNLFHAGTAINNASSQFTAWNYDKQADIYTVTTIASPDQNWGSQLKLSNNSLYTIPWGQRYTVSAEVYSNVQTGWRVDINTYPVTGSFWNGNDNDDTSQRQGGSGTIQANTWTKISWSAINTNSLNTNHLDIFVQDALGFLAGNATIKIRHLKLELNDHATPWIPSAFDLVGATGPQGPQGVPGSKGIDGKTTYVHVAYANSADGKANFNVNYFDNALYIGVLTDYTQVDSTDYTQYTWSRLKGDTGPQGPQGDTGPQGIPGPKGVDGQTPYVHFAYANSSDGNIGFNTSYFANALYVGTYTDYTSADSTNPASYTWSRLKGDTGPKGEPGSTGFFIGTMPPPNPTKGTVWATADSSGNMTSAKTWNGSAWASTAFTQDLVAGNITASKIVGGELDVNKITIKNAQNIPITSTVSLGQKLSNIEQDADKIKFSMAGQGVDLVDGLDGQLIMGYGITNTTWDGTNASLTLPTTPRNGEVLPQNAPFTIFYAWEAGKTYTQSIIIETDAQIDTSVQPQWTWFANGVHNPQPAELINLGNNCYRLIGSYTPNSNDAKGTLRIIDIFNFTSFVNITTGTYLKFRSPHFFCADDSSLSQLKITANSLNAYVKKSNGSQILSSILSMDPDNSIMGQLVDGKVVAAINLSKEGNVQIDGSHISLNSATTIPDATIKSAMIESVDASKIKTGVLDASLIRVINLDANSITTGSLSAVLNKTDVFQPFVVSPSNTWDFNYTKSSFGNWFLIGEITTDHVYNGPRDINNNPVTPYMYVTSRGSAANNQFTVTVWKDNDPTKYQRIWNRDHWTNWVILPNSQNLVSAINLSPDGVKIDGKKVELNGNIELNGNTKVTDRLDLIKEGQDAVGQSSNYHNPWNWAHAHIYFDNYLQLQGENCGVIYSNDKSSLNGGRNFYSLATLTPGYLKFTIYPNKVSDIGEDFSGQISRTYIDASRIEANDVWAGDLRIVGHHIRPADDKFVLVSNHAGTNFDGNGSVGFQVYGGVGLGQNTIYTASRDLYIQNGNAVQNLGQSYSSANKTTIHAQKLVSQEANTVSSRLSVKTAITKVDYDRALMAIQNTDMYDYRYTSDDSNQHYVSGIIDDIHDKPEYNMDPMLINKERTARIDANLLGYHHVVLQEMLKRLDKLEAKVNQD